MSLGNYCHLTYADYFSKYEWQQESSKTIDLKIDKMDKKIKFKFKSIIYVGNGEPLAYKRFPEITEFVYKNKLDQGIFTNGYLMNRYFDELSEYFTFVRISFLQGQVEFIQNFMQFQRVIFKNNRKS